MIKISVAALLLLFPAASAIFAEVPVAEDLRMTQGKSVVLDFDTDIRQISTSDPTVVDAIAVSTKEVLLHAKGIGTGTVVVWSRKGDRAIYAVTIEQNYDPLRRLLKDTFPSEEIQVNGSRDSLSLTGRVATKEISERATALATPFAKSVVNNLQLTPAPVDKQIMLRVKFAELNRRATKQFGFNLVSTGSGNTIGGLSTGQFSSARLTNLTGGIPANLQGASADFSLSDVLNVFAFRPDLNLTGFLKALQGENLLQILAEPTMVTTNGREASFLVGGEFPVPVLQGGGNAGAVTVQFREFGIRLTFTPNITANNTIKLAVRPEVSTIDINNAVTVSGFTIPALATRRMETNVELGEGQSFVIAGLIDNRVQETINRIPGLSNIPLVGQLFRSYDKSKSDSELVVIVTPEFTQAMQPGQPHPVPVMPVPFMTPLKPSDDASSQPKTQSKTQAAPEADKKAAQSPKPAQARAKESKSKGIPLLWRKKG
jgi:pilus assembly protein CpaC